MIRWIVGRLASRRASSRKRDGEAGRSRAAPHYDETRARIYGNLGIDRTTYEIGFTAVADILGNLAGKRYLDYGSGAGRSTAFLLSLGAESVIGTDHNAAMIEVARARHLPRAEFALIDTSRADGFGRIPQPNEAFDGALCANVFVEIRTFEALMGACSEVARVLRPGGVFVVMSTNPAAFGHAFRNFSYTVPTAFTGGATATCTITSDTGAFDVEDTYWDESDYVNAMHESGLVVTAVCYPTPAEPDAWETAERTVPPFIVVASRKRATLPG
jgi:SAM-dependent methyltransferase